MLKKKNRHGKFIGTDYAQAKKYELPEDQTAAEETSETDEAVEVELQPACDSAPEFVAPEKDVAEESAPEECFTEDPAPEEDEPVPEEEIIEEPAPVEEPVEEPAPIEEKAEEPAPVEDPAPIEEIAATEEPAPVEEPAPAPAEKPAAKPKKPADDDEDGEEEGEDEEEEYEEEEEEILDEPEEEEPEAPSEEEDLAEGERKKMVEAIKAELITPPRRRYIAGPKEVAEIEDEYTVEILAKSEMKENVQSVFKALVKEGMKLGYLDKYDGLTSSEIKEEYEGDIVYEVAEQELRKVALKICEVKKETKVGVYLLSWDGTDVHHVGYLDEEEKAQKLIPYLADKDNYIFNVCAIITGGKSKSVEADANGKIKIKNLDAQPYGVELDVEVYKKLS